MKPGDVDIGHRGNNFDFLRICAAYLVLASHSWPIFGREPEFVSALLGYESGGGLAVSVFFFVSGYLMYASLLRQNGLLRFAASRGLRILPGLAVTVLFAVFIVGPLFTTLPLKDYFARSETWKYLRNVLLFPIRFNLPGVFETNPARGSVNGSLWTLPIEVACYILLFILFRLRLLTGDRAIAVAAAFACASLAGVTVLHWSWTNRGPDILPGVPSFNFIGYGVYFFSGSAFRACRDKIALRGDLALCALLLFAASAHSAAGPFVESLALPYLIYYVAFVRLPLWRLTMATGDISYGVYIFAYPVQQSVYSVASPKLGFYPTMALSFAIATVLGVLSWRFIEKPALALKTLLDDVIAKRARLLSEPGRRQTAILQQDA